MSWTSGVDFWNRIVRKFTIYDVKLAQLWAAAWTMVFVKIFPQIVQISVWWFVLMAVLCAPRLFYVAFFRENSESTGSGE